jgi:hypothetical protein
MSNGMPRKHEKLRKRRIRSGCRSKPKKKRSLAEMPRKQPRRLQRKRPRRRNWKSSD